MSRCRLLVESQRGLPKRTRRVPRPQCKCYNPWRGRKETSGKEMCERRNFCIVKCDSGYSDQKYTSDDKDRCQSTKACEYLSRGLAGRSGGRRASRISIASSGEDDYEKGEDLDYESDYEEYDYEE